jgi:hypothetical protein
MNSVVDRITMECRKKLLWLVWLVQLQWWIIGLGVDRGLVSIVVEDALISFICGIVVGSKISWTNNFVSARVVIEKR